MCNCGVVMSVAGKRSNGSCLTGDNALDYVIEGAKVSAVDFNSCQIALVELKVRFFGMERQLLFIRRTSTFFSSHLYVFCTVFQMCIFVTINTAE